MSKEVWAGVLAKLVEQVGAFIEKEAEAFDRNMAEYKGTNDLVSYVDKEAERMLIEGLQDLVPNAGFITEEGLGRAHESGINWIIDPLDGTTNFIHGVPVYSISVALVEQEIPQIAVVRDVPNAVNYTAVRGEGAYKEKERLSASPVEDISEGLYATGFPVKDFTHLESYLQIMRDVMKQAHGLRRMGSAALDLVHVATGMYEGYFEYNLNAWDVAAGALLVEEAGGMVTDFSGSGNYVFGREILAAGSAVHPNLLALIKNYW